MSEVNEKKARKAAAAAEQAKKNKAFKRNAIIITVVVVLIAVCAFVINSDIFYTHTTAVEIGDTKYSPAEYNFYYNNLYSNTYDSLSQQYGELMPYLLDSAKPLSEQVYLYGDGTQTWHDYFHSQAIAEMLNVTVLYDAAVKAGKTLSEEDKSNIASTIATYEVSAPMYGYSVDAFMEANFGKGVDVELFREIMEKQALASAYAIELNDSFSYNVDELESYYSENKDSFDFVTYHAYMVSTSDAAFAELAEGDRAAAAAEAAAQIATATTPEEFAQNVADFVAEDMKAAYEDVDSTKNIAQGANLSADVSEWMLDAARVEGDTTVIDTESGSYVIMFVSRDDNHYNAVNARHILINAEPNENGEYTDEALATAKAKAEEILAEWELDGTEAGFEMLANTLSEDGGSNTNGGLYENIFKNQMVEEFDAFIYDESRQPGDTGIVYGSNGYYAGYHVIYYVGEAGLYSNYLAESGMRAEDYDQAVSALAESYETSEGFGMRFTGK